MFTLRLQELFLPQGGSGRPLPPNNPVIHPSHSLTSDCGLDCAQVLEQHHDAELSAAFINLQLWGHGTWAGREFTCKLTPSVCVENCTKETWESSNRDQRCTWKISAA